MVVGAGAGATGAGAGLGGKGVGGGTFVGAGAGLAGHHVQTQGGHEAHTVASTAESWRTVVKARKIRLAVFIGAVVLSIGLLDQIFWICEVACPFGGLHHLILS